MTILLFRLKKIDGVDSISNHRELAKKLTDISNLVNMICIAVVCALTIISIFIIANTISCDNVFTKI